MALLPVAPDAPLPQVSDSLLPTHLRTQAQATQQNLSHTSGRGEGRVALRGGGTAKAYESPVEMLSRLIATRNERFGMTPTDADKVCSSSRSRR